MEFWNYCKRLPRWSRWIAGVLMVAGIAGVIVGCWFIDTDWWDVKSFRINVASAFVGALVGIPVAVVGIGWFTEHRQNRVSLEEATNLTNAAWARFKDSAMRNTPPAITSNLIIEAREIEHVVDAIRNKIKEYQTAAGITPTYYGTVTLPPEFNQVNARRVVEKLVADLDTVTMKFRATAGTGPNISRDWTDLRIGWSYITDEIRRLRYAQELGWIPASLELNIETRVRNGPPLYDTVTPIGDVQRFLAALRSCLDEPTLSNLLSPMTFHSAHSDLDNHSLVAASTASAAELSAFRRSVLDADEDTWRSPAKVS